MIQPDVGRYKIAALFKFTVIEDPNALKEDLLAICKTRGIIGTLIIANEGINGTIAGPEEQLDDFLDGLLAEQRFHGMELKFSFSDEQPFYRTRISVKAEIVTMVYSSLPIPYTLHPVLYTLHYTHYTHSL